MRKTKSHGTLLEFHVFSLVCLVVVLVACGDPPPNKDPASREYVDPSKTASTNDTGTLDSEPASRVAQSGVIADTSVITHTAELKTSMGTITLGLYGRDAPLTVKNFVGLSKSKAYNDVLFHRVLRGFVIQGGDPKTKNPQLKSEWGTGGTSVFGGKEFDDELDSSKPSFKLGYSKGVLAMANHGANTNSSQFFICLDGSERLPKLYSIFGRVLIGIEVVNAISEVEIEPATSPNSAIPTKPIKILSVAIKSVL